MIEERSAGAVLFRMRDNKPLYLLLHYVAGHWDFPKGNIEEGEKDTDTVKREVKEETGIKNIVLVEGFKKRIRYYYKRNSNLVKKEVVFYLARTDEKDVKISYEHKDFEWLNYEDALKRVTYKNAKEVLRAAHEFLLKNIMKGTKPLDAFFQ
jgi:8-oxo-dGTP pyrophosphatase MutT (NUDIX family)